MRKPGTVDTGRVHPGQHETIDGLSLVPLFENPAAKLEREAIHFHYPHYHHSRPAGAIRKGPWKLIEFLDGSEPELYHLTEDIGETKNLAGERKGLVAALTDGGTLRVAEMSPEKSAALRELQDYERRVAVKNFELQETLFDPVEEKIEKELFSRKVQ